MINFGWISSDSRNFALRFTTIRWNVDPDGNP